MIEWTIPSMTCGHCAGVVTRTIRQADPDAQVRIDLSAQRITVQTTADSDRLATALSEQGYRPALPAGS